MTREEFMAKINAITEKGIAYANAHADEIAAARENDSAVIAKEIAMILDSAKTAARHSYAVYESFKNRIAALGASHKQYEKAIRDLADILGV